MQNGSDSRKRLCSTLRTGLTTESNLRSLVGPAPELSVPLELEGKFFCTFCHETGTQTIIGAKQDWKRHEEDYHETGIRWHCKTKGCADIISRGKETRLHSKIQHKGKVREYEVIQEKRLYACGFSSCRVLNYNRSDHCDHVARHMVRGHSDWSYNWAIRNLLKHPELAKPWKLVVEDQCISFGAERSALNWDPKNDIRRQLEYFDFGNDFLGFLLLVYAEGCSRNGLK